jgi:hypothetical protein
MNPLLTQKAIKIIIHAAGTIGLAPGGSYLHAYYYALGSLDMAKKLGAIDQLTAEELEKIIYQRRDEIAKFDF